MSNKHTPEPWGVFQDASGDVFVSSKETSFHICEVGSEDDDSVIPDARRIVACVNACRGLPTDELEQKGLVSVAGNRLIELERQLGTLLPQADTAHAAAHALCLPAGTDITVGLLPVVHGHLAALKKYEEAFDDLFGSCCSNGVFNAWGSAVDCTNLNEAHRLAGIALRGGQ